MVQNKSDKEIMDVLKIDEDTLKLFKKVREDTIQEAKEMASKKRDKIKVLGISGSARDEFDLALENSNSEELLKRCLNYCKELGADTELLPLRKYSIEHCKACYSTANTHCHFYCSCYPKGTPQADDMSNELYDKVLEADVIIFASPVNNFNISTIMKSFIDRCISLDGSLKPANPNKPKDKQLNIKHMQYVKLTADQNIPGSGMLRRFAGKIAGIIITGHEEGASMAISNMFMTLNHFGMMFPPFSNVYAMSSICNSTYEDKEIVLSKCYEEEIKLLANNMITAAKIKDNCKCTDWKYEYNEN